MLTVLLGDAAALPPLKQFILTKTEGNPFFMEEIVQALREQGIALYDPQQHRSLAFVYGQRTPGCIAEALRPLPFGVLAIPTKALKRIHEALALGHELAYPFSLAFTLYFVAALHQYRREGQAVQEQAEALITLSTEQGFAQFLAGGTILRGWALAEQGQREEGIAQIRQGISAWRATGAEAIRPYFLTQLAEAYGKVGQIEEGLNILTEALTLVDKTRERYYEAELYRLKGELTLKQSRV